MDRLACVNVAAFPLQLLLRSHPEWVRLPVAVVKDDRPQAPVLWANAPARRAGIRSGQRYATALALARNLQAGTVSASQIEEGVRALAGRLRRYSPHLEPSSETPGIFWLDAQGLGRLYPSLREWADDVRAELQSGGMKASVAVGFSRFGAYALAMAHRGIVVCADTDEEQTKVRDVSLARLNIDPDVRDRLLTLGIATVGDFLRLPAAGIRTRFGAAAEALHRLAAGHQWAPLVPVPAEEPHALSVDFLEAPENNTERLVFVIKRLLDGLLAAIARQAQAVSAISLQMKLDDRTTRAERICPAAPTLDVAQLLPLIYLRLNAIQLSAGIVTLRVRADTCPATPNQRRLFNEHGGRDTDAANQALARVRAECGEQSVVRARLCDAHLPAARFTWEPLPCAPARAAPRVVASRPLVRRLFAQPHLFPPRLIDVPDDSAPENRMCGPYVLSGDWWGEGIHRDYYFLQTSGDILWLYYDHRQQRFFLQGQVE